MPGPPRRRPLYLVLALLGALALGSLGACRGWNTVALYREPVDTSRLGDGIADEADRTAVVARGQAFLDILDAAKKRGWPIAVATLVLGGAVFVFAIRATARRPGSRAALVQLVAVQAVNNAAGLWLLRDVLDADIRFNEARQAAQLHASVSDRTSVDDALRTLAKISRAAPAIELTFFTSMSALVMFGLTRRRARDFLDLGAEAYKES